MSLKVLGLMIPTAILGQTEESEEVFLLEKEETPALY
jgi:hypothetical protein